MLLLPRRISASTPITTPKSHQGGYAYPVLLGLLCLASCSSGSDEAHEPAAGDQTEQTDPAGQATRGDVESPESEEGTEANEPAEGEGNSPGESEAGQASEDDGPEAEEPPGKVVITPDTDPPPPSAEPGALIGFATVTGHGVEKTTGGEGGETVTVTTFASLVDAVSGEEPRIVEIEGTIVSEGEEMIVVGSNKSIVGGGDGATIDGFGFNVSNWGNSGIDSDACDVENKDAFTPSSNVIIQNLTFENSPDDSINVQCYSHHVWIDHNTFFPANDGSIDVKRGADLVTISWNHFSQTEKTMLLGHSEKNGEQDRGFLRVTYHHNWFDKTATRTPRVRFGLAHVFNNLISTTDYFLGLGVEAHIFAEGNYVAEAKTLTQTFTESVGYSLTWTDTNHYDEETITRAQDNGKTMIDWLEADGGVDRPTDYAYGLDVTDDLPTQVPEFAGVGKL